ncbi:hypothetical protein MFIFM68171_07020 [Madurella fahalii]|uniref:Uncharacterized protein n=1 Tax=Madurella fahalii TaxID=1157608 RepID=A0ABQ0GGJ5_9PEZI
MNPSKFILVFERGGIKMTFCQSCRDLVMNTARDIKKHVENKSCFVPEDGEVEELVATLAAEGSLIDTNTTYNNWLSNICTRFREPIDPLTAMGGDILDAECGTTSEQDQVEATKVQRLTIKKAQRYIKVRGGASTATLPSVGSGIAAKLLQGLYDAETHTREISLRSPGDREPNDFLDKMRFEAHLAGYDPAELTWLMYDPKAEPDVRAPLDRMTAALRNICEQAALHIDSETNMAVRMELNRRPGDEGKNRQFSVISKGATENYIRVWKKILTYAMRVAVYQGCGDGADKITKAPPVTLTPAQLATMEAAMHATEPAEMESAMLALVDSLLRVEMKNSDFENIVTSALGVMAIDDSGGWKNAVTYSYSTPLGATLYIARLCLYEQSRRQQLADQAELGKSDPSGISWLWLLHTPSLPCILVV